MTTLINRVLGASLAAAVCIGYNPTKAEAGLPKGLRKLLANADANTSQKTTPKTTIVGCHHLSADTLQQKANPYHSTIARAAERYGVSANLVKAVITIESCFKPNARGSAGEKGLMQLMPGTARRFNVRNGYSAQQNINGGAHYLSLLVERYAGNLHRAVAAFNAGEGNVGRSGSIPNAAYVGKVMHAYNKFTTGSAPAGVDETSPTSVTQVLAQLQASNPPQVLTKKLAPVAVVKRHKLRFHLPTVRLKPAATQRLAQHKTIHRQQVTTKTIGKTTLATHQPTTALPWADKIKLKKS